jgi:hypothetical protein
MATKHCSPLEHLFLIDVRKRLINNTPYDVYQLASRFQPDQVEVVDLRFNLVSSELPASKAVSLFLETAGTWMCFDWDPARFCERLDFLSARYPELTLVGPQAGALRELVGREFRVVESLDFHEAILGSRTENQPRVSSVWLQPHLHRNYNGEYYDGTRMELAPTFSISYSMNCPLRCSFCYYSDAVSNAKPTFSSMLQDIEWIWSHGCRHFYFIDPNFLLSTTEFAELQDFYERSRHTFSYYCQVSPNFLSETRLRQLVASGCQGMVIGIENRKRIADKGSITEAQERIALARALGMMPMLFFMIDEDNQIEDLVEEFVGIPFRYTVINHAFASDRSLGAIVSGFQAKNRLSQRRRDLIARLQQKQDFLGYAEGRRQASAV